MSTSAHDQFATRLCRQPGCDRDAGGGDRGLLSVYCREHASERARAAQLGNRAQGRLPRVICKTPGCEEAVAHPGMTGMQGAYCRDHAAVFTKAGALVTNTASSRARVLALARLGVRVNAQRARVERATRKALAEKQTLVKLEEEFAQAGHELFG